jgi:inhibitor of KinA sporulation pathway (predicted exonuclease)
MNYSKIVLFDLEMCCWDDREPRTGEIIEVGIAEVDLIKQEITRTAQYYVKPDNDDVSAFCTKLTGITPAIIGKKGRPLADVLKTIKKNFGSNKMFGAWGRDDLTIFNECDTKGLQRPFIEYINVSAVYNISVRSKKTKISMVDAMWEKGLNFEGRQHSGLIDAINLARLAIKIL